MSDFLKNLSAALEKGESVDVAKRLEEILTKADEKAGDFNTVEKADAKVQEAVEKRKPLTAEEIKILNEESLKQQAAIDVFDRQMKIKASLVTIDLRVNKLKLALAEYGVRYEKLKDASLTIKEQNEIMQELLRAVNNGDNFEPVKITGREVKDEFNERDSE
jgi:hypothetical protein